MNSASAPLLVPHGVSAVQSPTFWLCGSVEENEQLARRCLPSLEVCRLYYVTYDNRLPAEPVTDVAGNKMVGHQPVR